MHIKGSAKLKKLENALLKGVPNKKATIRGLVYSTASSAFIYLFFLILHKKNIFGFGAITDPGQIAISAIELFAYVFLLYSLRGPYVTKSRGSGNPYGINALEILFLCCLSFFFRLYPVQLFSLRLTDTSHNIVFTAMVLVETATVAYAGFDLLNLNNLRWFLRTWPYSAIGIVFIFVAFYQTKITHYSILLENNTLANTILSFITITYFVQVFNERFCRKEDKG